MKGRLLFLCIIFAHLSCYSQKGPLNRAIDNHSYLGYLLKDTLGVQASLMNLSINYLSIPEKKSLAVGGLNISIGLNIARFFTKKIILGASMDYKGFPGNSKRKFSNEFISDFNSNYIPSQNTPEDSAIAYTLKGAINGESDFGSRGGEFLNFGICFSPFPQKYGGFIVELKTGFRTVPFHGTYTRDVLFKGENRDVYLQMKGNYSVIVGFNPYKFLKAPKVTLGNATPKDFYKFISIRFYYEKITFRNAEFHHIPIDKIVKEDFISKYSSIDNFGFAIGFAFY